MGGVCVPRVRQRNGRTSEEEEEKEGRWWVHAQGGALGGMNMLRQGDVICSLSTVNKQTDCVKLQFTARLAACS